MTTRGTDPPLSFPSAEERATLERELVHALCRDADALFALKTRVDRAAEDGVYRFFH